VFILVAGLSGLGIYCKINQHASIKATGSGGVVAIQVKPLPKIVNIERITLYAREETNLHQTKWIKIGSQAGQDQHSYDFLWNTLSCHNGRYTLRTEIKLKDSTLTDFSSSEINNLTIAKCFPENVLMHKEYGPPCDLYISINDNDTRDPMDIEVTLYKIEKPSIPVRTIRMYGVTGTDQVIAWDLKNDKGLMTTPHPYTFDVSIKQADTANYAGKQYTMPDTCSYRSKYLSIGPAFDARGAPITDWEMIKYSENGTKLVEFDDAFIYSSSFVLKDSKGMNASGGRMFVYNPDYEEMRYELSNLECKQHGKCGSIQASMTGIRHQPIFAQPVKFGQYAGWYYSFFEIFDGHASEYRDHKPRRALNF
jgi:hypothetical protein